MTAPGQDRPHAHPAGLQAVGEHHNGVTLLLPYQAPEVRYSLWQGALGCDEILGTLETLGEEGRQGRGMSRLLWPMSTGSHSPKPNPNLTGTKLALM